MTPREAWSAVAPIIFGVVVGGLIGWLLVTSVHAATLRLTDASGTWQMQKSCTTPTVARKGADLILRCDGALWITIRDAATTCPNTRLTKDAAGNLTLYC